MFKTYMRSSSGGTYDLCEFQYLLHYVMGMPDKPNFKTEKGSIVHKALELLAHRKVCEQEHRETFTETETGRTFQAAEVSVGSAVKVAWEHYTTKNESGHAWTAEDLTDCMTWTNQVIEFRDGMFNPLNRKVVCPERYFDLTIDEPWAAYEYTDPHSGEVVKGQLAIRGTVDLITEDKWGSLEYLDWKSGRRWDWGKDKVKEYPDLMEDNQLLLYFYALTRLYPDYPFIFVTIYYARDGGPFTMCFEKDVHVPLYLAKLKKQFETIRDNWKPKRIMDDGRKRWKCKSFCHYYKTKREGTDQPICDFIHREVQQLGLERVIAKHGKPSVWRHYGSGGGVSNRDTPCETSPKL